MITKRWKNISTGDEAFMRKVMKDFSEFCRNDKERLVEFYRNPELAT